MCVREGAVLPRVIVAPVLVQEMQRAVDDAEAKFHEIIRAAIERGLTVPRCFAHFDVTGVGVVTIEQFTQGLQVRELRTRLSLARLRAVGRHVLRCACRGSRQALFAETMHPMVLQLLVARVPLDRAGVIGLRQFEIFCSSGDSDADVEAAPDAAATLPRRASERSTPAKRLSSGSDGSSDRSGLSHARSASTSSLSVVRHLARTEDAKVSARAESIGSSRPPRRRSSVGAPVKPLKAADSKDVAVTPRDVDACVVSHASTPSGGSVDHSGGAARGVSLTPPRKHVEDWSVSPTPAVSAVSPRMDKPSFATDKPSPVKALHFSPPSSSPADKRSVLKAAAGKPPPHSIHFDAVKKPADATETIRVRALVALGCARCCVCAHVCASMAFRCVHSLRTL